MDHWQELWTNEIALSRERYYSDVKPERGSLLRNERVHKHYLSVEINNWVARVKRPTVIALRLC